MRSALGLGFFFVVISLTWWHAPKHTSGIGVRRTEAQNKQSAHLVSLLLRGYISSLNKMPRHINTEVEEREEVGCNRAQLVSRGLGWNHHLFVGVPASVYAMMIDPCAQPEGRGPDTDSIPIHLGSRRGIKLYRQLAAPCSLTRSPRRRLSCAP